MKSVIFTSLAAIMLIVPARSETPVQLHGQLRVEGIKIIDQHGNPTQLRGMSFFWSQWMGNFYNKLLVNWLVDDWKVSIVRAAMGVKHVESRSGYIYDGSEKEKVIDVVNASIRKGIYVIIDWHDHYAFENVKESERFFQDMAKRYGSYPNVIYEIFNEPIKVSWSEVVKPYAERIIKAIREIDPDNLIIVGTPSWCQNVDEAAMDPLQGENILYALHFYASTHGEDLREKARFAMSKGAPLFVSEFGTCLASGNGYLDSAETEVWFKFMDENNLSWCNWSIADKDETASILLPGGRTTGNWKFEHLSQSGKIIRHKLRMYAGI
ncbi:MAG: glycoside hydrolase family 5 protein, partial [Fibrobacter sp.]|nr:glycoside hydrolase family 5 protein [Fibrobacter sp.]